MLLRTGFHIQAAHTHREKGRVCIVLQVCFITQRRRIAELRCRGVGHSQNCHTRDCAPERCVQMAGPYKDVCLCAFGDTKENTRPNPYVHTHNTHTSGQGVGSGGYSVRGPADGSERLGRSKLSPGTCQTLPRDPTDPPPRLDETLCDLSGGTSAGVQACAGPVGTHALSAIM